MDDGTWGISGPVFLVGYLLLSAVVWVAAAQRRRALADGPDRPVHDLGGHEVAYLNGGPDLAVTSALTAMHLSGTVAPVKGLIHAVGRLDPGADALERAVHFTTGSPVQRSRLPLHRPVRSALDAVHKHLVGAGLLLSEPQRRRIRATGWWMGAVAGIGLLRLLAGVADSRPVGFLVVALLGVSLVTVVLLVREHHELDPAQRPDWVAYGPATAALGVGIFGAGALWASDPAFAEELAMQRATTGSGDGGGGYSGDGGGGSDGGGGGGGCGGGCGG